MTTDENRWAAAVHEAGHAIIARHFGYVTNWMAVNDAGCGWHHRDNEFEGLDSKDAQDLIPPAVTIYHAGEVAECLVLRKKQIAADDRRKIAILIGRVVPPNPLLSDDCRLRAREILEPELQTLDRLARPLAQRSSLSRDEIAAILRTG